MNRDDGMIVAAWPGSGKSFVGEKYENILDAESTYFQYVINENMSRKEFEMQKKSKREKKSEWPDNYIQYILKKQKEYDLILIPLIPEILNVLIKKKVEVVIVAPKNNLKNEYKKRYKMRGNSKEYIDKILDDWELGYKLVQNYNVKKIYLSKNKYLEDILDKLKIIPIIKKRRIKIKFPGRLEGNSLYPSYTLKNKKLGGGYGFSISMDNYLLLENGYLNDFLSIENKDAYKLISYYLPIFKEKFHVEKEFFKIELHLDGHFINHSGLSFNISIICALAYCFRNLFMPQLSNNELIKYLYTINAEIQNNKIYTKEIFTGISHNCAFEGGICFVGKNGKLLYSYKVPQDYKVLLIKTNYKRKNIDTEEMSKICYNYKLISEERQKKIIFDMKDKLKKNNMSTIKRYNYYIQKNSMLRAYIMSYIDYEKLFNVIDFFDTDDDIVGITYSKPNIYIITNNYENVITKVEKMKMDYSLFEISNKGIETISFE